MSTNANIIFASNYFKKDEDYLDKFVDQEHDYVANGHQIYVHFDGYPENILNILNNFFKLEGAKKRREDPSYLSAWFVTYYCMSYKLKYLQDFLIDNNYVNYFNPNLDDLYNANDFSGIGLHNGEYDDTHYTYVVTSCDITRSNVWIYGKNKKFIDLEPVLMGVE